MWQYQGGAWNYQRRTRTGLSGSRRLVHVASFFFERLDRAGWSSQTLSLKPHLCVLLDEHIHAVPLP